jgi:hypothetical protein
VCLPHHLNQSRESVTQKKINKNKINKKGVQNDKSRRRRRKHLEGEYIHQGCASHDKKSTYVHIWNRVKINHHYSFVAARGRRGGKKMNEKHLPRKKQKIVKNIFSSKIKTIYIFCPSLLM